MKKLIGISAFIIVLLIGFTDKTHSYIMLDCENLYDTCIDNNPYNVETQFFVYYGYVRGCTTSRSICLDMQ